MIKRNLENELKDFPEKNSATLLEIIRDNEQTEFGKKHNFSDIESVDEFRKNVPISRYEYFADGIKRTAAGEKNVLFSADYNLLTFGYTSGTTGGGHKLIPITERQMKQFDNKLDRYAEDLQKEIGGKRFYEQVFRTYPGKKDEKLLISEMHLKYKAECGLINYDDFVGGKELMFDCETEDGFFAKAYAMLAEKNVTVMEAIYQFDHLHFFTYMENNHELLYNAIKDKKIPDEISVSDNIKNKLLSIEISEERIAEIKREFDAGFDGIALRLWPKLKVISGISNCALESENELLLRYAKGVDQYFAYYFSTEGLIGEYIKENDYGCVLNPGFQFIEFLPEEDDEAEGTFLPEELTVGASYEPVITSFAGLYRYRMGDLIRVTGFIGKSPVFEVLGRRGIGISVAGESTNLSQLENAADLLKEKGVEFSLYCFAPCIEQSYAGYRMIIADDTGTLDESKLPELADECLKESNATYKSVREMKLLDKPDVMVVGADEFFSFLNDNKLMQGNKKPVHVAPRGFIKWR
ncbi:MAG: GH3 auxin-responsive promoter family protein [Eubacterium sp.]|nr:GH3 auxin-responsive promoter family protein [Eubacterium sp.]